MHLHTGGLSLLSHQDLFRADIDEGLGKLKSSAGTSGCLSIGNTKESMNELSIVQLYRLSEKSARGRSGEDGVRVNESGLAGKAGKGKSQCEGK